VEGAGGSARSGANTPRRGLLQPSPGPSFGHSDVPVPARRVRRGRCAAEWEPDGAVTGAELQKGSLSAL